jgi:hypothetical protein
MPVIRQVNNDRVRNSTGGVVSLVAQVDMLSKPIKVSTAIEVPRNAAGAEKVDLL